MQNDLMQLPAAYWLKRAARLKQAGDWLRASVLERHAVRSHPESDAACMHYAHTLRLLGCYEASSREAFAAMAADPSRRWMWGLIGLNMLSIGRRNAGLDALSLYLEGDGPPADHLPPWNDEACDMADYYCEQPDPTPRRRARLQGLLRRASRQLQKGDLTAARCLLERASSRPFPAYFLPRHLVWAQYCLQSGEAEQCQHHLLQLTFSQKAKMIAAAACMYDQLGCRLTARNMLMLAAVCARTPDDETTVCIAADQLSAPQIAEGMLRRSLRRCASRFPVCYNLCVSLLRQGRWKDAQPCLNLLREIDPDDPSGEILFNLTAGMETMEPSQVKQLSRQFSWYGAFSHAETEACVQPVAGALSAEDFPERLHQDARLRGRILQLMALPFDWTQGLASMAAGAYDDPQAEAFLREMLLQPAVTSSARGAAAELLLQRGAQPPFPLWADGRFLMADPTRPPDAQPTFLQRHLTRCIHRAQKLCPEDPRLSLWCINLVRRMTHAQRCALVRGARDTWPAALACAYCAQAHLTPPYIRMDGRQFAAGLCDALHTIHQITQGGTIHADH